VLFLAAFAAIVGLNVALAVVIALGAVTVAALPGLPAALRGALGFRLGPETASLATAISLLTANAKPAGLLLLGALAARDRLIRPIFDVLLAALLATNMALIGAALGAYGPRLVPWLVHLPVELAALAIPAGTYLHARRARLRPCVLLATAALTGAALLIAALVETYLTPHL
jgi:hypothetical protein